MTEKIIQLNEGVIKQDLKELVRNSVEETLNKLLEQEASELLKASRHERTAAREGYRAGHYDRNLNDDLRGCKAKDAEAKRSSV